MERPTYEQIAADWDLWREQIDTAATMTRDAFDRLTIAERCQLITDVFGPEVPSVENVIDSCPIEWGPNRERLVVWDAPGGQVRIPYADLLEAAEAVYDPGMPDWPACIQLPTE